MILITQNKINIYHIFQIFVSEQPKFEVRVTIKSPEQSLTLLDLVRNISSTKDMVTQ